MIKSIIKHLWKVCAIYFTWTILHFTSSHLYSKFCNELTLFGFITSPFLVTSPHCTAFRWCIKYGSEALTSMWIVLGTWLLSCLTPTIKKTVLVSTST